MNLEATRAKFEELYERADGEFFFAPGRVNLIGEHTDYNGGHALPCALDLGTCAMAAPRGDGHLGLFSLNLFRGDESPRLKFKTDRLSPNSSYGWRAYPLGVAWDLEKKLGPIPGADILFNGDLPGGAGLSSSASIEVLTAYILNTFHELGLSLTELALVGQEAENNFVGVNSGIMDQFASANCRPGHGLLLNCETLACQYIPINLNQASLWVVDSGKRRGLADSKYNERRAECEAALERVNQTIDRRFKSFGEMSQAELDALSPLIEDDTLLKRARHAVSENLRTLAAAKALSEGDLEAFGLLMNASHISLRDDYEVTGPEMDALVQAAWKQPETLGARMTGAGFGGCAVVLRGPAIDRDYQARLSTDYRAATGLAPDFHQVRPAGGVRRL